ncbi:MAG TPA: HEAT repeat domain-containing protein [Dehalococcoidia bacterium]|nr:HEAT repeat domain-containing protein [Dehalococcoidia bacterium]
MAFEDSLRDLADPNKRLGSQQLISFGDLSREESERFAETWSEVEPRRRLRVLSDLTDLAEDNVELNFDAVFKLGLDDEDAEVRAAAIQGLFEYENPDIIPRLAEMLREDPNTEVRLQSAIALGRYALAAEFDRLSERDSQAVRDALTASVEDLEEDEFVRARAIEALGAMSGEDTQNLIESIYEEGDSLPLRIGAVDAMGRSCDEVWLPIVLQELQSPAPQMRHAAAFAAGSIGDEEAVAPLAEMARGDPDQEVQRAAIAALGEIGGQRARVALKNLLFEGDDDLRDDIQVALSTMDFGDDPLGML